MRATPALESDERQVNPPGDERHWRLPLVVAWEDLCAARTMHRADGCRSSLDRLFCPCKCTQDC